MPLGFQINMANDLRVVLLTLLSISAGDLLAQNVGDIFGGITYSQISIKDESSKNLGTFKPGVVGLGLAYVVIENLALEANVFDGTSDSSLLNSRLGTVTVEVKNGYSLGLRPFIAFNESWGGYAKLGRQYGKQSIQPTIINRAIVQKPTDSTYAHTVYGLGVSYNIDHKWGLSTEVSRSKKIDSEQSKSSAISMGIRYKF